MLANKVFKQRSCLFVVCPTFVETNCGASADKVHCDASLPNSWRLSAANRLTQLRKGQVVAANVCFPPSNRETLAISTVFL